MEEINKPMAMSLEQIKEMVKGMPRRQRREILRKVAKVMNKQDKARLAAMRTIAKEAVEDVE
jgi:hypothetical protein